MNRKHRALLIAAGAIVLALVVTLFWPADRGPSYQGKTLAQWLPVCAEHGEADPQWQAAADAVRHIGTNGLPFLLKLINYETPPWREKLRGSSARLPADSCKTHTVEPA